MSLLLSPITHVLGRSLGKEQKHVASFRGEAPGTSVLQLGSKRKHSCLQPKKWEEGDSTAAQGLEPARARSWGGGRVSTRAHQRLRRKGKAVQDLLAAGSLCHLQPSSPQSMLGKHRTRKGSSGSGVLPQDLFP